MWGMGRSEGRPVDIFKPRGSLKHFNPLETGVDELTRSTLLKLQCPFLRYLFSITGRSSSTTSLRRSRSRLRSWR